MFCWSQKSWARKTLHDFSLHPNMEVRFVTALSWWYIWREKLSARNKITKNESTIIFYFSGDFCFHQRFIFNSFSLFRFAQREHFVALALHRRPHTRTPLSCCFYIDMTYHTMLSHYSTMLSRQIRINSSSLCLSPISIRSIQKLTHVSS